MEETMAQVHYSVLEETINYSFESIKKLYLRFQAYLKKWKVKFEWQKKYAYITFVQHYYGDREKKSTYP